MKKERRKEGKEGGKKGKEGREKGIRQGGEKWNKGKKEKYTEKK